MGNNEQAGKKIVKDLQKKFVHLSEENLMNFMLYQESKRNLAKATEEENELFQAVYAEEMDCYHEVYYKNALELEYIMEQLGYNNINFNLN